MHAGIAKTPRLRPSAETFVTDESAYVRLLKCAPGDRAAAEPKFDFQGAGATRFIPALG